MDQYGFAPATPEEDVVHGAAAPGGPGSQAAAVEEWIDAMTERGVERVVCLLSDVQLRRYDSLLDQYRAAFGHDAVSHVSIPDHELADEASLRDALDELRAAEAADEPVVAHCLAGIGRTGQVLAAWLVAERGHDPREAVTAVEDTGRVPTDAVRSDNATAVELYELLASVSEAEEAGEEQADWLEREDEVS